MTLFLERDGAAPYDECLSLMTARKPSCVVLGGGGFLGLNLCRHLASAGYRVRAFGRRCSFPEALEDVPWLPGHASDVDALTAAIESCETVFHLLGTTTGYSAQHAVAQDLHDNVIAALHCFDVSRKLGVKRIVFTSSGGAIYGAPAQIPTPETAPAEPFTAYGINKLAIEKYLAAYERFHGVDYRILRIANLFGPFQLPKKDYGTIANCISCALDKQSIKIWGDGSAVRDYVFADDVIAALESAMNDSSDQRIFNIGSGQGRTLNDVVWSVEQILNTKLEIDWKPSRPGDIPASVLAIDRARAVLGWTPSTPFEIGLRKTVEWWESMKRHP
ncbi:MAG: NAD-dependent epimerase/dehydratase family protein [Rhizobiales bacterium]|nr:NAD-dependent epimerase/dehydratase family protein [Hyphomicrobiales bacterium]